MDDPTRLDADVTRLSEFDYRLGDDVDIEVFADIKTTVGSDGRVTYRGWINLSLKLDRIEIPKRDVELKFVARSIYADEHERLHDLLELSDHLSMVAHDYGWWDAKQFTECIEDIAMDFMSPRGKAVEYRFTSVSVIFPTQQ